MLIRPIGLMSLVCVLALILCGGQEETSEGICAFAASYPVMATVNVSYYSPNGSEPAYLDAPLVIEFSEVMDTSSVEGSISISPEVENLTFSWDPFEFVLTIGHDLFVPDTVYNVTIGTGAVSAEGWPLHDDAPFEWSFPTGAVVDPWKIYNATVVLLGMDLTVSVEAPPSLDMFIAIMGAGYRKLDQIAEGLYYRIITGSNFQHDRTYTYFFTDSLIGSEKAPAFSGSFRTPEAPPGPVGWRIDAASVHVDTYGFVEITVSGERGMTLYLVIDGIGSVHVQAETGSVYYKMIPGALFESGRTYNYHFTNAEDGEDLAPEFSGNFTTLEEEPIAEIGDDPTALICFACGVFLTFLLIAIVIIFIHLKKRRKPHDLASEE